MGSHILRPMLYDPTKSYFCSVVCLQVSHIGSSCGLLTHILNSPLLICSLHLAPRLPNERPLPLSARESDRNRTPAHEPARHIFRKMEMGPRLGMPTRPQNMDLDRSAHSCLDSVWWHNHFRPSNCPKLRLHQLPSNSLQHAVRSCSNHCDARWSVRCYALESQVAFPRRFMRASHHRLIDSALSLA